MSLQASLLISGDATDAQRALEGLDQSMEGNEQQAKTLAAAYQATDASIKKLASTQTLASKEIDRSKQALASGEITLEQYNRELLETRTALSLVEDEHRKNVTALKQAEAATQKGTQVTRQAQAGYVNFGRQVQDVAVGLQGGQNIGTIIAQQGGQVADAVSQMGGKFGGLASFLAGPWGAAVIIGASFLASFVQELVFAEEAAGDTEEAIASLAESQMDIATFFDIGTGAIREQNQALIQNAILMRQTKRDEIQARTANQASEAGDLIRRSARDSSNFQSALSPLFNAFPGADPYGRKSGNDDIVRAVQGNNTDRDLRRIAESDSVNAERAEQLSALRAQNVEDKRQLAKIEAEIRSLDDGILDDQLWEAGSSGSSRGASGNSSRRGGGSSRSNRLSRQAKELEDFAKTAERSIDQINRKFGEQPGLIEAARLATGDLDQLVKDLGERKPPGFETMIADAQAAKIAVEDALVRPFVQMREEAERRQQVDLLILAGREDEAIVLEEIWRIEEKLGPLNADQRAEVEGIVLAEEEHLRQLEKAQQLQSDYLSTTQRVRGELEAIFAGDGDLGNLDNIYRDLKARVQVEQIFGPALEEFDQFVKENTAIPDAVDVFTSETGRAGSAAGTFADALIEQAGRVSNPIFADGGQAGSGQSGAGRTSDADNKEILVQGVRAGVNSSNGALSLTPEAYFEGLTKAVAAPVLEGLDETFGTTFFSQLQGALSGALYGSATAGTTGGVLGFAKGLVDDFGEDLLGRDFASTLSSQLGTALGGAQTGSQVAGLAGLAGINLSSGGSQLGGAVGSFLPIPGGDIIGAIAGGLLGGLFKKTPRGSANLTGAGQFTLSGNNKDGAQDTASDLAGSVSETLQRIADTFGGEVGRFAVSIGRSGDSYHVDPDGTGRLKKSQGGLDFDQDQGAAIAAAVLDAIGDGGIDGISTRIEQALKSSPNIDQAIQEALQVQELEELLGGIGGEVDEAFRAFERQAAERLRIATAYGFDVVAVEELNAKQRLELSEQLLEDQVGSLQRLIEQMTTGNLFEGSAVDRRDALLDAIEAAKADVEAGTEGAADTLASLLGQLDSVSKEVFGTTGGFATDRSDILDAARTAIAAANERISEAQAASDPALATTNAALDENNDQNAQIIDALRDLNINFGNGGSPPAGAGVGGGLAGLARTSF